MQLPINIQDLLTARTLPSERLEFKTGWHSQVILHTLCAQIKQNGSPLPTFQNDEDRSYRFVELPMHPAFAESTTQVPLKQHSSVRLSATPNISTEIKQIVSALDKEMSRKELQDAMVLKHLVHFRDAYLHPALEGGWIEMTLPDKLRSSKQQYRLTTQGKTLRAQLEEADHD